MLTAQQSVYFQRNPPFHTSVRKPISLCSHYQTRGSTLPVRDPVPRVSGRLTCVLTVRKERVCWRGETINSRSKCFSSPWAVERERYCNQQRLCLLTEPSQGGLKDSRLAAPLTPAPVWDIKQHAAFCLE